MNYAVKTDRVSTAGIIYQDKCEQTVDSDIKLPDYCPDIQKILKCRIEPEIQSRNIAGDRIEIEGTSVIRIIYTDAIKNSVRCTEQNVPFSITANLPENTQSAVALTDIRVSYLNCRAISPRRLNVHGAFVVNIKILDKKDVHVCTNIKGDDIQQQKCTVDYSELTSLTQQQFTVTEALETKSVQSVIRSDIRIINHESNIVSSKLLCKGDIIVKMMYLSDIDSGKTDIFEYNIPYSQVITAVGADDDAKLVIHAEIMNSNIDLRNEIGFDDPLPVLNARVCITVFSYEKKDTSIVKDCYSTLYKIEKSISPYKIPLLSSLINETVIEKNNIELTDISISEILDVWCENCVALCENSQNTVRIKGKYNICVLAKDAENNMIYTEKTYEYIRDIKALAPNTEIECSVNAVCVSSGYRISGENRLEIRAEIFVSGELYEISSFSGVTSASADENTTNANLGDISLVVYYAHKGESLWEIAKNHKTNVEQVRNENILSESDILDEDMMILLPI